MKSCIDLDSFVCHVCKHPFKNTDKIEKVKQTNHGNFFNGKSLVIGFVHRYCQHSLFAGMPQFSDLEWNHREEPQPVTEGMSPFDAYSILTPYWGKPLTLQLAEEIANKFRRPQSTGSKDAIKTTHLSEDQAKVLRCLKLVYPQSLIRKEIESETHLTEARAKRACTILVGKKIIAASKVIEGNISDMQTGNRATSSYPRYRIVEDFLGEKTWPPLSAKKARRKMEYP